MNGENPYAPPAVPESDAPSVRYWRTYGTSLFVRNGATLPEVDLETGVTGSDGKLKPIQRVHQNFGGSALSRMMAIFAAYFVLSSYFQIRGFMVVVCVFAVSFVLRLRGTPGGRIAIWTFTEARRARRTTLRRIIRLVGLVLLLITLFIIPLFIPQLSGTSILQAYMGWLALIAALAVWAFFDRPKYKIHAADPGWLRITPIHPTALEFLGSIEAAENLQLAGNPLPRRRLVHTTYYWRYPLRLLIGHHIRNPLVILRAVLMKLLRSRLLVRDSYHFSEAVDIPLEKLAPPLREAVESWLAAHPGWTFIEGEHLPSPAGDLMSETACLAAPGLDHCAQVSRAWLNQRPEKGVNHFRFITWLEDGSYLTTCDQPFLVLSNAHLHYRASGAPESVFQSHMGHLNSVNIRPATDPDDLRARLLHIKQETDRLLTEKGLQSEVREAG